MKRDASGDKKKQPSKQSSNEQQILNESNSFQKVEAHKKLNSKWWTIRSRDLTEYTKE